MKKVLIVIIGLAVMSCQKNKTELDEDSKVIIGKWQIDSMSWLYTDFNGNEALFTNYEGGISEVTSRWEFRNDGGIYRTEVEIFGGSESVDYSPGGWIIRDKKIKFTWQSNPTKIYEYAIKELNSDNLTIEYTGYSPTDTIILSGSPAGIYKRFKRYFSR